jgi:hypothetical protein
MILPALSSILARAAINAARIARGRRAQAARETEYWHRDRALRDAADWKRAATEHLAAARAARGRELSP